MLGFTARRKLSTIGLTKQFSVLHNNFNSHMGTINRAVSNVRVLLHGHNIWFVVTNLILTRSVRNSNTSHSMIAIVIPCLGYRKLDLVTSAAINVNRRSCPRGARFLIPRDHNKLAVLSILTPCRCSRWFDRRSFSWVTTWRNRWTTRRSRTRLLRRAL